MELFKRKSNMKTQQWSSIAVAALLGLCAANLVHLPALKTASAQNSDENSADADAGFARAYELSDAFRQVSKRALPAVVSIKTTGKVVKRNVSRRSPFDSDPFLREFFGNQGFGGFSFSEEGFQEREFR